MPELHNVVGSIDGHHMIYTDQLSNRKSSSYSDHHQIHAIHTQIIVDNSGIIRFIQSGFLEHLNDAQLFAMMDRLGIDMPFPHYCYILRDKIYRNRGKVFTQSTTQQTARRQCLDGIQSTGESLSNWCGACYCRLVGTYIESFGSCGCERWRSLLRNQ